MRSTIEKADILVEALPYIQKFRNALMTVKFGGSSMEDPVLVENTMRDKSIMPYKLTEMCLSAAKAHNHAPHTTAAFTKMARIIHGDSAKAVAIVGKVNTQPISV